MNPPKNIIISRTDSIGDVILTLPVAKVLKNHFPETNIAFLGKEYTRPIIEACSYVDQFIEINEFLREPVTISGSDVEAIIHVFPVAEIAKRARELRIPVRIGTTNRLFHLTTCNKLVKLSRKNSELHEAQLNLKLLKPFDIDQEFSLDELRKTNYLDQIKPLPQEFLKLIDPEKYNLILHPKSQGSAREWGLKNFLTLIDLLEPSGFKIFISGTSTERELLHGFFEQAANKVTDITGIMKLEDFISFIDHCDGLIANSTGPLHIAASLGKDALGIYPPIRPMHPGRWAPIGIRSKYFVLARDCSDCRKNSFACSCIAQVNPIEVAEELKERAARKCGRSI